MIRKTAFLAAIVGLLGAAGCSDATGQVFGGTPLFDAAPPPAACRSGSSGTGTTFSSLYQDYFGPTGVSSCAKAGKDCHGGPNEMGTAATGYICPLPGDAGAAAAQTECFNTMTGATTPPNSSSIVPSGGSKTPATSLLLLNLRGCYASGPMGNMPNDNSYAFSETDVDRISTWISSGAANN